MARTQPKADDARKTLPFTRHVVLRIAVEAMADPKTVYKVLRGEQVRGSVGERIRNAVRARGLNLA